jgi:hypothetical protein
MSLDKPAVTHNKDLANMVADRKLVYAYGFELVTRAISSYAPSF